MLVLYKYQFGTTLGMQNGMRTNITPKNFKKVKVLVNLPDTVSFNDCLTVLLTKLEKGGRKS